MVSRSTQVAEPLACELMHDLSMIDLITNKTNGSRTSSYPSA